MKWPAIASLTYKETIRNRILINILLFAVALIGLSLVIGEWSLGEQAKVIKDFGLSAMSLFGLLIAIFIGIRLMVQELEQKTLYLVASKPVRRWEILFGKFAGLSMTLLLNVILMLLALWAVDWVIEKRIDFQLAAAVVLIYVEILLIVAFALFFSSLMSPTLAAVATLAVFIAGHLSQILRDYVQIRPGTGLKGLYMAIYYVIPNLENLNLKMAVVEHLERPPHAVGMGILYGVLYLSFVLIATCMIFEKKDLK